MIAKLIDRVTASGVVLSVDAGMLRGRPADKLTPFAAELKAHRSDVIALPTLPTAGHDEWAEQFAAWLNIRCAASQ